MVKRTALAILMCAVMVLVAAVPVTIAGTWSIVKGEKGPNNSAVTWEYAPVDYGVWSGHVVNNGLRSRTSTGLAPRCEN